MLRAWEREVMKINKDVKLANIVKTGVVSNPSLTNGSAIIKVYPTDAPIINTPTSKTK